MDRLVARATHRPTPLAWRGDRDVIRELMLAGAHEYDETDHDGSQVVKSGPHRTVRQIELPSGGVYFKHFKLADWRAALRNVVLPTPAEREAVAASLVHAAGIATIDCAAVAVARSGVFAGESYLVTREIPGARPLDDVMSDPMEGNPPVTALGRRELARSLGELAGRLHRAKLTHRDLHPGNILASPAAGGCWRLWLIDLQKVRRHARLPLRIARDDFCGLHNFFYRTASRSDRRRFLLAYCEAAGVAGREVSATRLEAFVARRLQVRRLKDDRKWQRSHRRLIVMDRGSQACRGIAELGRAAIKSFREDPERLFDPANVRSWRRRSRGERSAVVDLVIGGRSVVCDVIESRRPLRLRDRFLRRWSTLRRAWEMGHALRRRGLNAARPVLYVECGTLASVAEYLVAEQSQGMVPLSVLVAHHFPSLTPRERERRSAAIARSLGTDLRRLHAASLHHAAFESRNVLVAVNQTSSSVSFGAPSQVSNARTISWGAVATTFATLNASLDQAECVRLTHRLRFLKRYLGERFEADWKRLWSEAQREYRATTESRPLVKRALRAASCLMLLTAGMILGGCHAVDRPVALPVKHSVRSDQLLVLSDIKLPKNHALIKELNALREQVARKLELPLHRDPVVVYLFNNETEYRRYMAGTFPGLPPRSAYFVGTPTELAVYTHWGDNVREDLRHEYTHGLLHSVTKKVPVWLDEGLAEYFEVPGAQGMQRDYAQKLSERVSGGWRPDLKRLEGLGDTAQLKLTDYQESWGWVHYMLNSTPEAKQILLGYLKDLRTNNEPKAISQRLGTDVPGFQQRFTSYIGQLNGGAALAGPL